MLKALLIVMSSGENELSLCLDSISSQVGVNFDVYHIENKPNKEAHEECYKKIMTDSGLYDYFIKVDADMVFINDTKLKEVIQFMYEDRSLDHAAFSVLDWASQKLIIGMHVFSNRCKWEASGDLLFVDPSPCFPGKEAIVWGGPSPVALHSPNPSIKQAIQFGCHRALKILQKDRELPDLDRSSFQYDLMHQIYKQLLVDYDVRRLAILYGVMKTLKRTSFFVIDSKNHVIFSEMEKDFLRGDNMEILNRVNSFFGGGRMKVSFFFSFTKFCIWRRFFFIKIFKKVFK